MMCLAKTNLEFDEFDEDAVRAGASDLARRCDGDEGCPFQTFRKKYFYSGPHSNGRPYKKAEGRHGKKEFCAHLLYGFERFFA